VGILPTLHQYSIHRQKQGQEQGQEQTKSRARDGVQWELFYGKSPQRFRFISANAESPRTARILTTIYSPPIPNFFDKELESILGLGHGSVERLPYSNPVRIF